MGIDVEIAMEVHVAIVSKGTTFSKPMLAKPHHPQLEFQAEGTKKKPGNAGHEHSNHNVYMRRVGTEQRNL